MAITAGGSTETATPGGTNPYTMTVDIGTRTNGLLVVGLLGQGASSRTITAQTYAGTNMGVALQRTDELVAGTFSLIGILYLANPTNGSNTLSVTLSGTVSAFYLLPSWWDGADQNQATVLDQTNSSTGATDPSVSITPGSDNQLIYAHYFSEAANPLTIGGSPATPTELQNHDFGPRVTGGGYTIQTTAGAQTMSWSGTDDVWSEAVASFKAFVATSTVKSLAALGVG